jgi:hypothetical protein
MKTKKKLRNTKKPPIQIFHSYEEANEQQFKEALAMKPGDRVAAVDEIRKRLYLVKGINADNIVVRKHMTFAKR